MSASSSQNFSVSVTSNISARWVQTGGSSAILRVQGAGSGRVRIRVSWDDDPDVAGDAMGQVCVAGSCTGTGGENGNVTFQTGNLTPGDYGASFGAIRNFRNVSNTTIQLRDNDGDDSNGEVSIQGVNQNTRFETFSLFASVSWQNGNYVGVSGDGCPNRVFWGGSVSSSVNNSITINSGGVTRFSGNNGSNGNYPDNFGNTTAPGTISRQRCTTSFHTAINGVTYSVQACATATCRNDTDPDNFGTPTRATNGANLLELEPQTTYTVNLGNVSGINAPTQARSPTAGLSIGRNGAYTTENLTFNGGENFSMRFTTPAFNTSTTPGGTVNGEIVGQYTNIVNYTAQIGSGTANDQYTISTRVRRPVIQEFFNFEMPITPTSFPNPDIDTVASPNPLVFTVADNSQTANDIEIPNEIRVSDGNAQVRLNFGGWRDMRQL